MPKTNQKKKYIPNMNQAKDLTTGPIAPTLSSLAFPIIGASFVQMTYNLTDMFWVGQLGGKAVAAVGAAAFFAWLGHSFAYTTKIGAEVTVSQSLGSGKAKRASFYASHAITLALLIAALYVTFTLLFSQNLIGFFQLGSEITADGANYLRLITPGFVFGFLNITFSGIYNASGNSRIPLLINGTGLLFNMILDPLLIYGWSVFPEMGISGAAIATSISQLSVTLLFIHKLYYSKSRLFRLSPILSLRKSFTGRILSLGIPVSIQSVLFCLFSMFIAQLAAQWGYAAIAAQSLGAQIEAVTWMSANGLSTALGAFVGQNWGAKKIDRIRKAYRITILAGCCIGIFATILFYMGGEIIFNLFVNDSAVVSEGARYLKILAFSQVFMMIEAVTAGAFNGHGLTRPATVVGVTCNGLRIPLAYLLTSIPVIGVTGVWWSISATSILKGISLFLWYKNRQKKIHRLVN